MLIHVHLFYVLDYLSTCCPGKAHEQSEGRKTSSDNKDFCLLNVDPDY